MMNKQIVFLLVLMCLTPAHSGYSQTQAETSLSEGQGVRPELDIILVLDNSGSMKKNDPEFLTHEVVTNFLFGVGERSRLGMITFDKVVHLHEPLKTLTGYVEKAKFLKSLEKVFRMFFHAHTKDKL